MLNPLWVIRSYEKNYMKLNPLMKLDKLSDEKCIVKLLIDRKTYKINREMLFSLLDIFEGLPSYNEVKEKLVEQFGVDEKIVENFLDKLKSTKILLDDWQNYPIQQIEYWKKHKWLNALIYHLESQNVECFDDDTNKGDDKKNYELNSMDQAKIWKRCQNSLIKNLPKADFSVFDAMPFEEVLLKRNSFSPFNNKPIKLFDFSNVLAASNTDLLRIRLRLEESTKSLYDSCFTALETYVFVFSIEDLNPGLYHYNPKEHNLSLIKEGDLRKEIEELCIGQRRAALGGCLFLLVADPARYMLRYKHERAYRNLLVNVAEFAQQYIFYSTALGYSTFLTPAIKDEFASHLLGIDGITELPLYTVAIG